MALSKDFKTTLKVLFIGFPLLICCLAVAYLILVKFVVDSQVIQHIVTLEAELEKYQAELNTGAEKKRLENELAKLVEEKKNLESEQIQLQAASTALTTDAPKKEQASTHKGSSINPVEIESRLLSPSYVQTDLSDIEHCSSEEQNILLLIARSSALYDAFELSHLLDSKEKMADFIVENMPFITKVSNNAAFYFQPLVEQLLIFHERIVETEDWQAYFDRANSSPWSSDQSAGGFYRYGFPESEQPCFSDPVSYSVTSNINYYAYHNYRGKYSLDNWFYNFWRDRYVEGTFEVTSLALKAMSANSLSEQYDSMDVFTLSSHENVNYPKEDISEYSSLLYGNFGREDLFYISVDSRIHGKFIPTLLSLSSTNNVSLEFDTVWDGPSDFFLIYKPSKPKDENIYFFTPDESFKDQIYSSRPVDKAERVEIEQIMKSEMGSPWGIALNFETKHYCLDAPTAKVSAFELNEKKVFLVSAQCKGWGGEGVVGPTVSAIFEKNVDKINMLWSKRQTLGEFSLHHHYIADLDRDGNVELIVDENHGVGSTRRVFELVHGDMQQVLDLAWYGDGEEEPLSREHNTQAVEEFRRDKVGWLK